MRQTVVKCHVQHTKMLFLKEPNLNIYVHSFFFHCELLDSIFIMCKYIYEQRFNNWDKLNKIHRLTYFIVLWWYEIYFTTFNLVTQHF